MNFRFDPRKQLIVVKARLLGPAGDVMIDLALDTGASSTLIGWNALEVVGYSVADAFCLVELTTGSGTEQAPKIKLRMIESLGKRRRGLGVVAHTLPPSASVDGLLGLDFLRKFRLTVNFRNYTLHLD